MQFFVKIEGGEVIGLSKSTSNVRGSFGVCGHEHRFW